MAERDPLSDPEATRFHLLDTFRRLGPLNCCPSFLYSHNFEGTIRAIF